jgi:anti-sigma factor RsiW
MRCSEVQECLSEFLDLELAHSRRQEVSEHLDGCADCRDAFESLSIVSSSLRVLPAPLMPAGLGVSTIVALDREVEPPMTIVTRQHHRIPPHFSGSLFDVLRQLGLDYEFKLVSYGLGVTFSVVMFAALLAVIRPLVSIEPFVPSSERMIWVTAAEGMALGGPSTLAGHSLARVPDEGSVPGYASSAHLVESEELVVLAEVAVDGRASIVEVLSGSPNPSAITELAMAINRPKSFIPARGVSGRPVVSRVVLFLGHVDVLG